MIGLETEEMSIKIGKQTICQKLNLSLKPGEIWGILGINGSGKTTFLHTLAGLHPIQSGEIRLLLNHSDSDSLRGYSLSTLSPRLMAQWIGILFQDFTAAFSQSVWEYCKGGRYPHLNYLKKETKQDQQIVMQSLAAMELTAFAHRNILHLSGGEKRRLAIASLLAQSPQVYLLDEPTNHLDIYHQMRTLQYFKQLAKAHSATIVMSLHDINIAQQFCTHLLLLFANGTALQGPRSDILTTDNLSALYQYPLKRLCTESGVYWQPESGITT